MPGSVAKSVRVPWPDRCRPGKLSSKWSIRPFSPAAWPPHEDLYPPADQIAMCRPSCASIRSRWPRRCGCSSRTPSTTPADYSSPRSGPSAICSSDGGNFDQFVRSRDLVKQEGILFKHLLRMILFVRRVRPTHAAGHDAGGLGTSPARNRRGADDRVPSRRSAIHR